MTHDQATKPSLQTELVEMFRRARMPSSPVVAARILDLINDPNSDARQFATVLETDVALAARLLRLANSARYAQRRPVTTIQRAVTVVGLRQLRVLALGFELVRHLDRLGDRDFDLRRFWQHSLLRGCVARELARRVVPELAEEAFLVGLLMDSGIIVLVQVLGPEYAELCRDVALSPTAFHAEERRRFRCHHVQAVAALADLWSLPDAIATPMAQHHRAVHLGGRADDRVRLGAVAHFVGTLSLGADCVAADTEPSLAAYARHELRVDESGLELVFEAASAAFTEMASAFDDNLGAGFDAADLLLEANRRLLEEATASEQRASDVEAQRDEILDQQQTLRNALGQYREQAARDPLTGLLNRRALLDEASLRRRDTAEAHEPVAVTFLDLDDFKQINDRHGHAVGDEVLRTVAAALGEVAGTEGVVGRYGGEEFVLVRFGRDERAARDEAEWLLDRIRAARPAPATLAHPITCSIGTVWCPSPRRTPVESLIAAADELMYAAKRGGKDRACFRALPLDDGDDAGVAHDELGPVGSITGPDGSPAARFRRVAEALDRRQRDWAADDRKQHRPSILRPCVLHGIDGPTGAAQRDDAFLRNVSAGGAGLLVSRPLRRAEIVEIEVASEGRTIHLAGIVAFCRRIEEDVHEVGVQVVQSSDAPIIAADGDVDLSRLDWAARALEEQDPGGADVRRSA